MSVQPSDRVGGPTGSDGPGDSASRSGRSDRTVVGTGDPTDFWHPDAIPAATVMIIRERAGVGTQTLMLKRDPDLTFAGGMWVFPGGRIDDDDLDDDLDDGLDYRPDLDDDDLDDGLDYRPDLDDGRGRGDRGRSRCGGPTGGRTTDRTRGERLETASRRAAARETIEEAGLVIDRGTLIRWSHWTAPPQTPRRFTTAFYLTVLEDDEATVRIDDHEIREYRWMTPQGVLEDHASGRLGLTPPTFITLTQLLPFRTIAELTDTAPARPIEHFATRFVVTDDSMIAMYHGDAGYDTADSDRPGPRHRLILGSPWRYERTV